MSFDVTLATNRLILSDGSTPLSSITYTNIVRVMPPVIRQRSQSFGSVTGNMTRFPTPPSPATVPDPQWIVRLHVRDVEDFEEIPLGGAALLITHPGWTNDATGYANAESDIYAAFP